jgi:hypothetical protein
VTVTAGDGVAALVMRHLLLLKGTLKLQMTLRSCDQ